MSLVFYTPTVCREQRLDIHIDESDSRGGGRARSIIFKLQTTTIVAAVCGSLPTLLT